jgi:Helix-turn-helix domain
LTTPAYLTTAEAAAFLRISPKTLRNKAASGIFREGEHFFRRPGLGPRWKLETLVSWLESSVQTSTEAIPMARSARRGVAGSATAAL